MSGPDRELQRLGNAAKRARRVPPGSTCAACGTDRDLSVAAGGSVRCYAHLRGTRDATELDHWVGVANLPSAVLPLRANAHRRVTEIRGAMGFDDLPQDSREPLLLLAHLLEAIASLLVLFAEWLVDLVMANQPGQQPPPFPVVP
jgi:hypothetical protein